MATVYMKEISAEQVIKLLTCPFEIIGELPNYPLIPKPINIGGNNSFSFVDKNRKDKLILIDNSSAVLILCPTGTSLHIKEIGNRTLIELEEPKLEFVKIINNLYKGEIDNHRTRGIDKSASIHPEAKISSNCYIGPNTYIGKSTIEEGCILHGNIYIYDNVNIGKNVIIHAGTIIGAEGFGFLKDGEDIINFPHIGGVIIEENVEIGANACIDRGALGYTTIHRNVKIDNLVHIAHNVVIEESAYVIANAMIGGSTRIGKNAYIAPSATLRDVITIGEDSLVGMGAVVTKNIPSNSSWTGSPARELREFISIQSELKKLANK